MVRKISLYRYIASDENAARKAKAVMESFGYNVTFNDQAGFAICLSQFVNREGEDGLLALAMVHPDRDLILETIQDVKRSFDGFAASTPSTTNPLPSEIKQTSNADSQQKDHTPIVLVGIFGLAAICLTVALVVSKK